MNGSRIKPAAGLTVMICLIILVFVLFVDLDVVAQQLKRADPWALLAASGFLVAGLLAYAYRWRLLLSGKPSMTHTFHASNIGHAANILIPARFGEVFRIMVMASKSPVTISQAASSVVVERLFEQFMRLSVLIAAVSLGMGIKLSPGTISGGAAAIAVALGGISWLIRHQETALDTVPNWLARLPRLSEDRVRGYLAELLDTLAENTSPSRLGLALLWSIIPWLLFWAFYFLSLAALSGSFPAGDRVAVSLGALALSPPSAPTQPGLFHASVVAPLAAARYNVETLTAYAIVLHILEMVWMVGLALIGLSRTGLSARSLLLKARR